MSHVASRFPRASKPVGALFLHPLSSEMIQGMNEIFRQQSAQFENQNCVMNEFLTNLAAAITGTPTLWGHAR